MQQISELTPTYHNITNITQRGEHPPFLLKEETNFKTINNDFESWLITLGYTGNTVKNIQYHSEEFFTYLSKKGHSDLSQVRSLDIVRYYEQLNHRKHKRTGSALQASTINKHRIALLKLSYYLHHTGKKHLPVKLTSKRVNYSDVSVLSSAEISQLYKSTNATLLGERDKAMLAIYYGCGLRRSEGINLNIEEVNLNANHLFVSKSKNGYQRHVPLSKGVKAILSNYLYQTRPLLAQQEESAFLVSARGTRIQGQTAHKSLKALAKRTTISKHISLHVLRHSIATHLLQSGMPLEKIAQFLGHKSLDSTQIYTHIVGESLGISH